MKKLDNILLIDDNEATNFLHKLIIEESGYSKRVTVINNGVDALEYLKNVDALEYVKPEIIFLDINMPGMNGWEFLEEYEKFQNELKVKSLIVMLTTSINPNDIKKAKLLNLVDGFKSKPLTLKMLEELIKEL